jgi:hypothetical protein
MVHIVVGHFAPYPLPPVEVARCCDHLVVRFAVWLLKSQLADKPPPATSTGPERQAFINGTMRTLEAVGRACNAIEVGTRDLGNQSAVCTEARACLDEFAARFGEADAAHFALPQPEDLCGLVPAMVAAPSPG